MKIRNGFVSNSSSSSSVIIATKENYRRALEKVHPYVEAVIEALEPDESKFLGRDIISIATWDSHGGSQFDFLSISYNDDLPQIETYTGKKRDMRPQEAFYRFEEALEENGDEIFTTGIEF
jgi:hypothetical protein